MIHDTAVYQPDCIGAGCTIGAFSYIAPTARIGSGCVVAEHVVVGPAVHLGDGVRIGAGAQLLGAVTVSDEAVIEAQATILGPDSHEDARTTIGPRARVRAGAVIEAGVSLGADCVVEVSAAVGRPVPSYAIVAGNPAHITGYVATPGPTGTHHVHVAEAGGESVVHGVKLVRLTAAVDLRGQLVAAQAPDQIPFDPSRIFVVFGVPSQEVRGEHAHRECAQFMIAASGAVSILVDDGQNREEFRLESRDMGLLVPPMTWGVQYKYTPDAALLVLASRPYEAHDYIRDYETFLAEVEARRVGR